MTNHIIGVAFFLSAAGNALAGQLMTTKAGTEESGGHYLNVAALVDECDVGKQYKAEIVFFEVFSGDEGPKRKKQTKKLTLDEAVDDGPEWMTPPFRGKSIRHTTAEDPDFEGYADLTATFYRQDGKAWKKLGIYSKPEPDVVEKPEKNGGEEGE